MILDVPLSSDFSYIFTIILEQVTYRIRVNWVGKEDSWYMDLYDRLGEPLILGHKITYNSLILNKYHANERVPQGEFLLLPGESGGLDKPTFNSVSNGDTFYYITSDELV